MLSSYYNTSDSKYKYESIGDTNDAMQLINRILKNQSDIVSSYLEEYA